MTDALFAALRPLLFRLPPETAHEGALSLARQTSGLLRFLRARGWSGEAPTSERLRRRILGRVFPNPIGLAAGFDKNGLAPHLWPWLGFGFAELGTVTALAQPGNPKPRMFRLPEQQALINRLGFNNEGAASVAARLRASLDPRPPIPLGLNIGASRVHMGDRSQEVADYRASAEQLGELADYVAINVSSPNTPGLRQLQEPERLTELVGAVGEELGRGLDGTGPAVLVKLAPDLDDADLGGIATAALAGGAQGFISTNTTLSREGLRGFSEAGGEKDPGSWPTGGMSGAPLRERSLLSLRRLRQAVGPDVPIIGVGGISSVQDVVTRLEAGADLVALYSSMIFEGPFLARRLAAGLDHELQRRGMASVAELKYGLEAKHGG